MNIIYTRCSLCDSLAFNTSTARCGDCGQDPLFLADTEDNA